MKNGIIKAISISPKKGTKKQNTPTANLIKEHGIEGDAHAGKWHRQVSFLATESIDKMIAKGMKTLKPGDFAENLTTEFIDVPHLPIGSRVKIGKSSVLEITQIGKKCHNHCEIFKTVGDCVMPREGVFARVIESGEIQVGDEVVVINDQKLG
jgi:molybdopterin adenylyltransferase